MLISTPSVRRNHSGSTANIHGAAKRRKAQSRSASREDMPICESSYRKSWHSGRAQIPRSIGGRKSTGTRTHQKARPTRAVRNQTRCKSEATMCSMRPQQFDSLPCPAQFLSLARSAPFTFPPPASRPSRVVRATSIHGAHRKSNANETTSDGETQHGTNDEARHARTIGGAETNRPTIAVPRFIFFKRPGKCNHARLGRSGR